MRLVDYAGQFLSENVVETTWDNIAVRHLVASLVQGIKENRGGLRDTFAISAMNAFVAELGFKRVNQHGHEVIGHINGSTELIPNYEKLAQLAYKMADAMLEARLKVAEHHNG